MGAVSERWWAGGYTLDAGGSGDGIHLLASSAEEAMEDLGLATGVGSPSFVATHPTLPVVYAVSEVRGEVAAYSATKGGALTLLDRPWDAAALPCHIGVDPAGRFLLVSCWGSGDVVLYRLGPDGRLLDRVLAAPAIDPHGPASLTPGADPDPFTGEGRRSRAHTTFVLDDRRVVSTDLGFDLVRFWTYDDAVGLVPDYQVVLSADTGPRHLVAHPDGRLLVVTEYSCEVVLLERSGDERGGTYTVTGRVAAVRPEPGDTAAEIALSPDARFVYVGVRGSDRLSTLAVGGGRLDVVDVAPSGGRCPRHHVVGAGVLHVAHEDSDEVTTLELDPATGVPGRVLHRLRLGSPTAVVRARWP
jgi:6-phosphogluconolactonase